MSEQVLNKVRDLLALANDKADANESAAAYKVAQKLLTKHRLSMADLEAAEDDRSPIITADDPLYAGRRAITWKGILAQALANANCCGIYWNKVRRNRKIHNDLKIVGRQSDIDIVRYLFNTVVEQIDFKCRNYMLKWGGGKTAANNFKIGAVQVVSDRVQEAQKEVEKAYDGSTALVLVKRDKEDVDKFMKENLNLKPRQVRATADDVARMAGRAAGKKINLNRGKLQASLTIVKSLAQGLIT